VHIEEKRKFSSKRQTPMKLKYPAIIYTLFLHSILQAEPGLNKLPRKLKNKMAASTNEDDCHLQHAL
jgi:hypothetical protein